jgi:hypothetical protein
MSCFCALHGNAARVFVWASRAGRYTGGYPVPGCGKHLSHQCRGDREEASPLTGGREIALPCGHPVLWMAARAASWVRAHSRKTGRPQVARTGNADALRPSVARVDTPPASLSSASISRPTTGRHACFVSEWPMLGSAPPARRWPRRISRPPSTRLGPAAISTEVPVPC